MSTSIDEMQVSLEVKRIAVFDVAPERTKIPLEEQGRVLSKMRDLANGIAVASAALTWGVGRSYFVHLAAERRMERQIWGVNPRPFEMDIYTFFGSGLDKK